MQVAIPTRPSPFSSPARPCPRSASSEHRRILLPAARSRAPPPRPPLVPGAGSRAPGRYCSIADSTESPWCEVGQLPGRGGRRPGRNSSRPSFLLLEHGTARSAQDGSLCESVGMGSPGEPRLHRTDRPSRGAHAGAAGRRVQGTRCHGRVGMLAAVSGARGAAAGCARAVGAPLAQLAAQMHLDRVSYRRIVRAPSRAGCRSDRQVGARLTPRWAAMTSPAPRGRNRPGHQSTAQRVVAPELGAVRPFREATTWPCRTFWPGVRPGSHGRPSGRVCSLPVGAPVDGQGSARC